MAKTQKQNDKPVSNGPKYLQQVGLVILGAIIGIGTSFVTTQMQAKMQLKQFMLDRQLITLKEYSTSFNQDIGSVISRVQKAKALLNQWEMFGDIPQKSVDELYEESGQVIKDNLRLFGSLNSQRIMVNALFGIESSLPSSEFLIEEYRQRQNDIFEEFMMAKTEQEQIRLLNSLFIEVEKMLFDKMKTENEYIYDLALKLQQ